MDKRATQQEMVIFRHVPDIGNFMNIQNSAQNTVSIKAQWQAEMTI